jgi:hypothetical protein
MPRRESQHDLLDGITTAAIPHGVTVPTDGHEIAGEEAAETSVATALTDTCEHSLSVGAAALRDYLRQHPVPRRSRRTRRRLLDSYRPNVTSYLRRRDRLRLAALCSLSADRASPLCAGQRFGEALEIELAWNAARVSGSRYGRLEARRLLKFDVPRERDDPLDTQGLLNQRDAVRYLLAEAGDPALDRHTLCNLHAILAHNLLPNEAAAGRLRRLDPRFRDASHPDGLPVAEAFEYLLHLANAITDPLEQALFLFVQVEYLAPFECMNDRVARLAASIPLVHNNLAPLSFEDVPAELLADAERGVVERGRIDLLRDVFLWACERSASLHGGALPAADAPDPFRLRYDRELRAAIGALVRGCVLRRDVASWLDRWAGDRMPVGAKAHFQHIVLTELCELHEGNFARYPVSAEAFRTWQAVWSRGSIPH